MEAWMKEKVNWLLENATPNGECLICHLTPNAKGYCNVSFGRQIKWRVHRLVCHVLNGPVESDVLVRHTCDTRSCINPAHLITGTSQDNTNDMITRGRAKLVNPRQDHIYRDDIIRLYKEGLSRQEIAQRLLISVNTVWNYISPKGPYYVGSIN